MAIPTGRPPEEEARILYSQLVNSWNSRDATGFAALFTPNGKLVNVDGSQLAGREEIAAGLRHLFIARPPPAYVGIVRSVHSPQPDTALLRAVAGMVPAGVGDIDPDLNVVQGLIAVETEAGWRTAVFDNTPARFRDEPELSDVLSRELRARLLADRAVLPVLRPRPKRK